MNSQFNSQFRKREHIVSTRLIELLFGSGSMSMAAFPLRAVFRIVPRRRPADAPVQVLISVPKKRFKHAVDRNRVKRQVREAYRLCKQPLCDAVPGDKCLLLAFVWIADELKPSVTVADRVQKMVKRVAERIGERKTEEDR